MYDGRDDGSEGSSGGLILYGPWDLSAHLWVLMHERGLGEQVRVKGFRRVITELMWADQGQDRADPIYFSSYLCICHIKN